jgi:hypothetical protein
LMLRWKQESDGGQQRQGSDRSEEAMEARRQWRRGGNGGEEAMEVRRQWRQGGDRSKEMRQ